MNLFLSNGVVSPGVVVCGVLLPADHIPRVEQSTVGAHPDLIDHLFTSQCTIYWEQPTVGSRSTNTALGVWTPVPVSAKNVLKELSSDPINSPSYCKFIDPTVPSALHRRDINKITLIQGLCPSLYLHLAIWPDSMLQTKKFPEKCE